MNTANALPDELSAEEMGDLTNIIAALPFSSQNTIGAYPHPHTIDLLKIARDAMGIFPPRYVASILGKPITWLPPHRRFSEFNFIDIWHWWRTIKYLMDIALPAMPVTPPSFGPPCIENFVWRPTVILQRPVWGISIERTVFIHMDCILASVQC